jgi:hypothetical protein
MGTGADTQGGGSTALMSGDVEWLPRWPGSPATRQLSGEPHPTRREQHH